MPRKGKKALLLVGGLVLAIGLLAASSAGVDRAVGQTSRISMPHTAVSATPLAQGWTISGTRSYMWAVGESPVEVSPLSQGSHYSWSD